VIDAARRKDERARSVRFDTRAGEREKQILRSLRSHQEGERVEREGIGATVGHEPTKGFSLLCRY